MKLNSKIIALISNLFLLIIFNFYHYFTYGILDIVELLISITLGIILLWLILKYDNIKLYSKQCQEKEHNLNFIFNNIDAAIWSVNLKTDEVLISRGFEKLCGFSNQKFKNVSNFWKQIIHPDDLKLLNREKDKLLSGEIISLEYRIICKDNKVCWVKSNITPNLNSNGDVYEFNGIMVDITDRKKIEKEIIETTKRYNSIFEQNPDAVFTINSEGNIMRVNHICEKISGYNKEELLNMNSDELVISTDLDKVNQHFNETLSGKTEIFECTIIHKDGHHIKLSLKYFPLIVDEEIVGICGIGRDITKHKDMEEKINYMAYHDTLTDLPNRNLLNKLLEEFIVDTTEEQQKLAILFIDLDRFKMINDTIGHDIGDMVLQQAAERLIKSTRKDDIVARFGGDEFIVGMKDINRGEVDKVAQRIIDEFSNPFIVDNYEVFTTPSIGISLYPNNADNVERLIKYADIAMYSVKESGKNDYQFFNYNLDEKLSRKVELEKGLRKALANNEFTLRYQPQINIVTGKIIGVEALLRWKHPQLGNISPGEFIPIAEETGLIKSIGEWVLKTACKQNKAWQNSGLPPICMAVNVSKQQFHSEDFVDMVTQVLESTQLNPKYLELEITENSMYKIEHLIPTLNQLKDIGIKIAIDDFGTGYSSLSILNRLPIDNLKIDQNFIHNIVNNSNKAALTKTIINMGIDLNFNVTAEGVETYEQKLFLTENQCNIGQGYLFAHPLLPEKIKNILNKSNLSSYSKIE
ncbi:sensor domain-containing protein [Selenihalanaerobacter shriftii]|uniref:sensor domain-containing protein n=1 Tax=Selenihalanaerobacter shriftii TaxID=142842 RepID=UPI001356696D|nr:bifunctional diguanylate cyclase/phosphodiesterase [Selenihalanaerobacter shriftii]